MRRPSSKSTLLLASLALSWVAVAQTDRVAPSAEMSRADIAVPAGGGTLDLQLNYNIEEDFDYAYLEGESPAGSGTWAQLPTTDIDPDADTDADENGIDAGLIPR